MDLLLNNATTEHFPTSLAIYFFAEILLSILITFGNVIVLISYIRVPSLQTSTNGYIFSLAMTDFLTGLVGIPLTVFSVATGYPSNFHSCILVHIWILILSSVSILHLLAMSLDKYVSIARRNTLLCNYQKNSRAKGLIVSSWVLGFLIGSIPLYGWHPSAENFDGKCEFLKVIEIRYLIYVIFCGTIIVPTVIIMYCYVSIYRNVVRQTAIIASLLKAGQIVKRKNQLKLMIKSLFLIVVAFLVCWYPLYILNAISFYYPSYHIPVEAFWTTVVISHFSSALNPCIYAYGLPGFKMAFVDLLKCRRRRLDSRRISISRDATICMSPFSRKLTAIPFSRSKPSMSTWQNCRKVTVDDTSCINGSVRQNCRKVTIDSGSYKAAGSLKSDRAIIVRKYSENTAILAHRGRGKAPRKYNASLPKNKKNSDSIAVVHKTLLHHTLSAGFPGKEDVLL